MSLSGGQLLFYTGGGFAGVFQQTIEGSAVEIFSAKNDRVDGGTVADIGRRITAQENEVSLLADAHRAPITFAAEELSSSLCGALQGFQGSETCFDELRQLKVQADSGNHAFIEGVRAGQQGNAGGVHLARQFPVVPRKLREFLYSRGQRRVFRRAGLPILHE